MSNLWSERLSEEAKRAEFWPQGGAAMPVSDVAEAFARGLQEGRQTVEAEFAGERDVMLQLIEALEALTPPSIGLMATLMVAAVERLVTDIAGNVPIDPMILIDRAGALAELIAAETEAVLVINPEDLGLLGDQRLGVKIMADAAVPRGTVQARSGDAIYEDGVAGALTRLRTEITRMGILI